MFSRAQFFIGSLAAVSVLAACAGDPTSPSSTAPTVIAHFSGGSSSSSTDTLGGSGGGGGGGGGGTGGNTGGGGSSVAACGTLSADISTYNIVVYTTRIGIGFSGTATNCGTRKEAFEVDVVNVEPDAACYVDVPHFIAPKYTDPGLSTYWSANSTLVPCQNQWHTFDLTLRDTRTNTVLATTRVSAYL